MRDGWTRATLGEVAQIVMGQSPPGSSYNTLGRGLPFLQGSAEFGYRHPAPVKWCTAPKKIAQPGDLLISVRAPVGSQNFADQELSIGRGLATLRGGTDATTEFLALTLERGIAELLARSGGGMFSSITGSALASVPVVVPPLVEQRRIVDLVASADAALRGDTVSGAAHAAALRITDEIDLDVETTVPLADVASKAKAGATPSRNDPTNFVGEIPWLKSGEVDADRIRATEEAISERALTTSSTWLMPAGTIVVAMYGQGPTAGNVGFTDLPMASNQAVLGLVPNTDRVDPRFLYHWLRSRKSQMRARRTGSSQPNLNKELVLQERVPLLPMDRQQQLAAVLDALLSIASAAAAHDEYCQQLRAGLLADLLSGNHEIPESYDRLLDSA